MPLDTGSTNVSVIAVGQDRVDRIAAVSNHLQSRLRGQRLRRGDHVARQQGLSRPRIREVPGERSRHPSNVSHDCNVVNGAWNRQSAC